MSVIVAGVGTQESGHAAARYAAQLASRLGSRLVLAFGYEASAMGPRGGPLEDQILAIAEEITGELRADLVASFPGLVIDVELVRDRPAESLVRVAEAVGAELIVVGHGGRGPLRAALLGSTTYELVHRAPVPVVVCPDGTVDSGD
jgi:nucleotide-binding universal stress UspA family protein